MHQIATVVANFETGPRKIIDVIASDATVDVTRRATAMYAECDRLEPIAKGGVAGQPWHQGWVAVRRPKG